VERRARRRRLAAAVAAVAAVALVLVLVRSLVVVRKAAQREGERAARPAGPGAPCSYS
jgi:hypothetical protein